MAVDIRTPATWQRALLDLLYPPHCVVCDRAGSWWCDACAARLSPLPSPCCPRCGRPTARPRLCRRCRTGQSPLQGLRSLGSYTSTLRLAIHALKYDGVMVLADPLAAHLAAIWQQDPWPVQVVVPVPLHASRVRDRGYNQAELLARAFGARVGLPVVCNALVRQRATRSQVGLNIAERHANVRDAFACAGEALRGQRVLLLDDVYTTGATLEAAAQALARGGVGGIWALTLARALDPSQ